MSLGAIALIGMRGFMFDFAAARAHMIEGQIRTNDVTDLDVLAAFRRISRENFMPRAQSSLAYSDVNIDLGEGRYMPRPRDFAKMVQAANIKPSDIVLDVACGRGYSTAILAGLADTVVGLEDNAERVEQATQALINAGVDNAAIVEGDLKSGAKQHGPFNVIFVNGAVPKIVPTWVDQLTNDGRLIVIVKSGPVGRACVMTKSGDAIGERIEFDASLPILTGFEAVPEFEF